MTPPIVSFIGWSGVGKTTFLERLIPLLKAEGIRLALLKQDGHEFDMDREGKDSWRFSAAGADVVTIANAAHAAVLLNRPTAFEEILQQVRDVDLILTEGYHNLNYPQIEIHRKGFATLRCLDTQRLIAVVTDEALELEAPQFSFAQTREICTLLKERISR